MVSIKDVARHCGTSISTVSNVINGTKYVSPELAGRIRAAIEELGYQVNPVARSLKSKKSGTVGVIVTNIDRIFFTRVIKGIQEVLAGAGYRLAFCSSGDSLDQERAFFRMLCDNWADGILVDTAASPGNEGWFREMAEASAAGKPIPVVGLECRLDKYGLDSAGIDNRRAAADATRELLKSGCRRLAHITGVAGSALARDRLEGFLEAAGGAEAAVEAGDFSPQSGYAAMLRLLDGGAAPDGLFAANDQMAVGALEALSERGVAVPGGMRVMGFDDTFVASLVKPSLSTVHAPKFTLGVAAASQLLARMGGDESAPRHIGLDYRLVCRQSTGAEPQGGFDMTNW